MLQDTLIKTEEINDGNKNHSGRHTAKDVSLPKAYKAALAWDDAPRIKKR